MEAKGERAFPKGGLINPAKATFKQVKQSRHVSMGREAAISIAVQLKERLRM